MLTLILFFWSIFRTLLSLPSIKNIRKPITCFNNKLHCHVKWWRPGNLNGKTANNHIQVFGILKLSFHFLEINNCNIDFISNHLKSTSIFYNNGEHHTFSSTCFSLGVMYMLHSCSLTHRFRTSANTSSYPCMVSSPSFNKNVILFWFAKNSERFCDSSIIETSPVPRRRKVSAL